MEHSVRRIVPSHQLIEPRGGTGEHVIEICRSDYNTLGFARSSRRVKNSGGVLWCERDGRGCNLRCRSNNRGKDLGKQRETRRTRPCGRDGIAKGCVTAANQARSGVTHHRDQFVGSLAGVKRNRDDAFCKNREIKRGPPDAIRSDQGTTISLCKARRAKKSPRRSNLRKQVRSRRRLFASSSGCSR